MVCSTALNRVFANARHAAEDAKGQTTALVASRTEIDSTGCRTRPQSESTRL